MSVDVVRALEKKERQEHVEEEVWVNVRHHRNGITPPRRGPLFCTHFVALLKFSKYKIIWPVMALACGSLHTVVTFVPNG
jgi:hypothetical protein